jgi:Type II CAAX prenyl endopeptidase Rce1-like
VEKGHPARHRLTDRRIQQQMHARLKVWLSLADVILFPAFILWFIWKLQFTARWTWIFFALWLAVSFLLHRDTPKILGWRADNLAPATKQAVMVFGLMAVGLVAIGFALGAPKHPVSGQFSWRRVEAYFASCVLQQVALNSLLHNRMMSLIRNEWIAAGLTGLIFAACHWPNPVLVPLTFVGGASIAWMFGRIRNIIPLVFGQVLLGMLVSWAFPMAWHHHLRIGPGYYTKGW